jgi:hypothetical protein
MGASVSIDNNVATGLILQREIKLFRDSRDGVDVEVGEVLEGFVERYIYIYIYIYYLSIYT